jgi:hypothetical protein
MGMMSLPPHPIKEQLNTLISMDTAGSGITAPEGAGHLKGVNLHAAAGLWPFDYDGQFSDDDRDAVSAAISGDRNQDFTSCRGGTESAGNVRGHDRFGLPTFRHFSARTIKDKMYCRDTGGELPLHEELLSPYGRGGSPSDKNERPWFKVLDRSILKYQGLSPLSSACLYRRIHNSTPCAMLAKSLASTFFSRYAISSGGSVIVKDCFFLAMHERFLHEIINTRITNSLFARIILAGLNKNESNTPTSVSYADPSETVRTDIHIESLGDHGPRRKEDNDADPDQCGLSAGHDCRCRLSGDPRTGIRVLCAPNAYGLTEAAA